MDYSLQGSSVHGLSQARILERVAIPFSRGSFWCRGWTWVSCIAGRVFAIWATSEAWYSLHSIEYLTLVTLVSSHILPFFCWHLCWRCQTYPGSSWMTEPVSQAAQWMHLFSSFFNRSYLPLFWAFIFYCSIVDSQCFFFEVSGVQLSDSVII